MGLKDKDYQARLAGMAYALKVAREQGMEELEKEVKRRGAVFVPLEISQKKLDDERELQLEV